MEAQRHGHTLILDLEESLPDVVGDRDRILQVMMNVVSNSIKYTPGRRADRDHRRAVRRQGVDAGHRQRHRDPGGGPPPYF